MWSALICVKFSFESGPVRRTPTFFPKQSIGSGKYGNGLYTMKSYENTGLALAMTQNLVSAANFSKSKETWSSYGTDLSKRTQYQIPFSNDHKPSAGVFSLAYQ